MKNSSLLTSTPLFKNQGGNIGYPEVTLHPIQSGSNSQKNVNDNMGDAHTNSLLHGILTKVCGVIYFRRLYFVNAALDLISTKFVSNLFA